MFARFDENPAKTLQDIKKNNVTDGRTMCKQFTHHNQSLRGSITSKRAIVMPTKRLNAQHLVEYQKQFLQEENKKSGNVMQQTMHSYVCGINLRSESSLVLSDLHFA